MKVRVPGPVGPPPTDRIEYPFYPSCDHPRKEIRRKIQSNNVTVAVRQCLTCGANCGAVPKRDVPTLHLLREFDEELRKGWQEDAHQRHQRACDAAKQTRDNVWWAWYNSYLISPQWYTRRRAVLARDVICRGCSQRPSQQVHHLTYARVGHEMLFDLVGVCNECHNAIHATESSES